MIARPLLGLICVFLLLSCNQEPDHYLFEKVDSARSGVSFVNRIVESEDLNVLEYMYFYNGGGVAVGDLNNDGLDDIYFTGNLVNSHLYINEGDLKFIELGEEAGVAGGGLWNTGVCMADVNADGWLDIYVCRSAASSPSKRKNLLFINQGLDDDNMVSFKESAALFGLDDAGYSTQAAFFDYDLDGDLDMYLLNHSTQEYAHFTQYTSRQKEQNSSILGDKLYRNDEGRFTDVSAIAGIKQGVLGFGLGLSISDLNMDGYPDVYVGNDYNEEDYLYLNKGDGMFEDILGAQVGHTSMFSMGNDCADYDNDLRPDIYTLDMLPEDNANLKLALGPENHQKYQLLLDGGFHPQTMRNMLQKNAGLDENGRPLFMEVGEVNNVSSTNWSWSALFADLDLDGWKDLYVTNGYGRNYLDLDYIAYMVNNEIRARDNNQELGVMSIVEKMPPIKVSNYAYKNEEGEGFVKKTNAWGFDHSSLSNGAAYGDFDNDGDLDLVVNNINEEAFLYKNLAVETDKGNYLKLNLEGTDQNHFGIGAKVYLHSCGNRQMQEMYTSRGFQSSVSHDLVFGLGDCTRVDSLVVVWPEGYQSRMYDIAANQTINVSSKSANFEVYEGAIAQKGGEPIFKAVDDRHGLVYRHKENHFEPFSLDRMLIRGLSDLGPKIETGDVNGDGLVDLWVCGGKGQPSQIFLGRSGGGFYTSQTSDFDDFARDEDIDAEFVDIDSDGDLDLYVVSGGSESESSNMVDHLYLNDGKGSFQPIDLLDGAHNGSVVKSSDINSDGTMDIFVGGLHVPGQYPKSSGSYFWMNDGKGSMRRQNIDVLEGSLVTDAAFVDINDDGHDDLVVVGEWMEVTILMNNGFGEFTQVKDAFPLSTAGWWNCVTISDVNGDGKPDIIAGNFGLNSFFGCDSTRPIRMYSSDIDDNGTIDPIVSHYKDGKEVFAFSRDELIGQVASMKKKFPDYKSFASSSIQAIMDSEEKAKAEVKSVIELRSTVFLNKGDGAFTMMPLPKEVQYTSIYAIEPIDLNDDGLLDLVMGGNHMDTRVSMGPLDASYGLVLINQGEGHFKPLEISESGMVLRGAVRDLKTINYGNKKYVLAAINDGNIEVYGLQKEVSAN